MAGRLFELFGLKPRLAKLSCWGNGGRCSWDLLSHNTMQNDPWKIAHLASHQIRNASGRLWLRIMTQFEAPIVRWSLVWFRGNLSWKPCFFHVVRCFSTFFSRKVFHLTPEISTHLLLTPQLCQSLTFFHAPATTTCTPASNRTGGNNRWFLSSAQSSKFYVSGLQ